MAISFAGGTDQAWFGNGAWFASGTQGCHAFRIKTTQVTANTGVSTSWNVSGRSGLGFILNESSAANKITAQGYDAGAGRQNVASTTSVNDGNWHHVAFNWDAAAGQSCQIFVDGAQEATAANLAAWVVNSNDNLFLGKTNSGFWASFVGSIAEYGVWSGRKLTADEIAALGRGYSPSRIAPDILTLHCPLGRSGKDYREAALAATTGTTVADHPRVLGGCV